MKTILRHGNEIRPTYEFCCDKCGCVFRMTNEDLQKEQQSIVFVAHSKCPDCNNLVTNYTQVSPSYQRTGVYEFRCNKCNKYFYKSEDDISVPDINNIIHSYCPYCNDIVESSKDRFIKLVNLDR